MIILRQKIYTENQPMITFTGKAAPKTQAPYIPNFNQAIGAKQKQQAMLDNARLQGQSEVGLLGGAKNTWKGMNNTQKGLVIGGAAAATIGTGMLIARNRKKRKDAERELELERARNRR